MDVERDDKEKQPETSQRVTPLTEAELEALVRFTVDQAHTGISTARTENETYRSKGKSDVVKPNSFSGEGADTEDFLAQVQNYFWATGNENAGDQQKIAFTLSLMNEGVAPKAWVSAYHVQAKTQQPVYKTWDEFVEALKGSFFDYHAKNKAFSRLATFKQGKQDTSTFITRFQMLAHNAGVFDATESSGGENKDGFMILSTLFQQGLNDDLYNRCLTQDTMPTTMKEWYALALKMDSRQGFRAKYARFSSARNDDAMDVDTVQTQQGSGQQKKTKWEIGARLNDDDREEHRKNNLCFFCHYKGHSARDCRKKQASGQRNNQRTKQAPKPTDRRASIRALLVGASEEEKTEIFGMLTEEDF